MTSSSSARRSTSLSARRALAGVVATLALAGVMLLTGPGERLANTDGDTRAPLYDVPLDDDAFRRLEVGPTYYVRVLDSDPLLRGNAKAAAQLYLAPSLPVLDFRRADSYIAVASNGRVGVLAGP